MAGSVNKVLLVGNVGRDPERRGLPSGEPLVTFSVATTRRWTGADGQIHEETEWHHVVAWRTLAERCHTYLTKGRKVYVEGHLQTRAWADPTTGERRTRTEIVAEQLVLLDARGERAAASEPSEPGVDAAAGELDETRQREAAAATA